MQCNLQCEGGALPFCICRRPLTVMTDQFRLPEDTRPDEVAFQRLGYAMVPKQYIEAAGKPLKVRNGTRCIKISTPN